MSEKLKTRKPYRKGLKADYGGATWGWRQTPPSPRYVNSGRLIGTCNM